MRILINLLLACLFFPFCLLSQNPRQISFIYSNDSLPVSGVKVFIDDNLETISDRNGICIINSNKQNIRCEYSGFEDTVINIGNCNHCTVVLNRKKYKFIGQNIEDENIDFKTNKILLEEVKINDRFDGKNFLLKKLENTRDKLIDIDTILYYKFTFENYILNNNQKQIITGIVKIIHSRSINWINSYTHKINSYHNSIDMKTEEKLTNVLPKYSCSNNILSKFCTKKIEKLKTKKTNFMPITDSDSTNIVQVSYLDRNQDENNGIFYKFLNDILVSFNSTFVSSDDKAKRILWRTYKIKMYYSKALFSADSIPFIDSHLIFVDYNINSDINVLTKVRFDRIEKPYLTDTIPSSLKMPTYFQSPSYFLTFLKNKYPEFDISKIPEFPEVE